ncbi:MAG TPA: hypothetical protein HPP90_10710, partial [Deltaproteobacteria bacterium]|nr:hypothetical protein [Deltaproteobacteria bacterium]
MDRKAVTNKLTKRGLMDRGYAAALLFFAASLLFFPAAAGGKMERKSGATKPEPLPINRPVQITFRTDPVLYAAASVDGDWLLYVSEKQGLPELWLRSADPSKGGPPE